MVLAVVLLLLAQATGLQGQGLIPSGPVLSSTAAGTATQSVYATLRQRSRSLRSRIRAPPCSQTTGSFCSTANGTEARATFDSSITWEDLLIATSPGTHSSRNPADTSGLQLLSRPGNQENCNSCTSFAVAAAAEAAVAAALRVNASAVSISPYDLHACNDGGLKIRSCTSGASMQAILSALQDRRTTLLQASCRPLPGANASDLGPTCPTTCTLRPPFLDQGLFVPKAIGSVAETQEYIRQYGGVLTRFVICEDMRAFFGKRSNAGLVYKPRPDGRCDKREDHAVLLVGYDNDQGWWLVRNSWGPTWADGGYFKVSYDCCGILSGDTFALSFTPGLNQPLPVQPVPQRPNCYLYQATPSDYLFRIGSLVGMTTIDAQVNFVADNVDRVSGDLGQRLGGKTLVICNPAAGTVRTGPANAAPLTLNAAARRAVPSPTGASSTNEASLFDGIASDGKTVRLVIPRNSPAAWMYGERALSADDAQRFCAQAGGELARITSADDAAAVVRLLGSALGPRSTFSYGLTAQASLWFGLTKSPAGNWTWRDGSPVAGYLNWGGYEPSTWGPCSVLGWFWNRKTAWYAYPCAWSNMALPFLCRLPSDAELPPGMFPTPLQPAVLKFKGLKPNANYTQFSYTSPSNAALTVTLYLNPLNWDSAVRACRAVGAELFNTWGREDQQALNQAAAEAQGLSGLNRDAIWLGAERLAGTKEWVGPAPRGQSLAALAAGASSSSGNSSRQAVPDSALFWNPGEPNAPQQERICVHMNVLSSLRFSVWHNDHGCDVPMAYACVKAGSP